ncbi:MAG: hypothetical protein M0017_00770 [Desulfobacteraceae bacterium]|nr:hypothetical protein [Desulfobacteraceae bacterium]
MQRRSKRIDLALAAMLTGMLAATPALANNFMEFEDHHGGGERGMYQEEHWHHFHGREEKFDGRERHHREKEHDWRGGRYFTDHDRVVINNYFAQDYPRRNCPPGLARKHNGCMPPGLARRYVIGRRLPPDVVYYEVPPQVVAALPPCPPHHKYVRVAQDILLLATGTGMVEDAIDNLSWESRH